MLLILPFAYSQDMEQVLKERKEISKMTRSELDARASKSARKEARKYEKEGWQVVYLQPDSFGRISPQQVEEAITPDTALKCFLR